LPLKSYSPRRVTVRDDQAYLLEGPTRYLSLGGELRGSLPAHLGRKVLARTHVTNFWKVASKSNVQARSTSSATDLTNVEVSARNT
jgi:hypothetical protein